MYWMVLDNLTIQNLCFFSHQVMAFLSQISIISVHHLPSGHTALSSIALSCAQNCKYPCNQIPYFAPPRVHGRFMCTNFHWTSCIFLSYIHFNTFTTNAISFDPFSLLLTLRMPHQFLVTNNAVLLLIFSLLFLQLRCTYDHVMN